MFKSKYMSEGTGSGGNEPDQSADDYLSKLAQSILSKEKTARPSRPASASGSGLHPPPAELPPATARQTPRPPSRPSALKPVTAPPAHQSHAAVGSHKDWIREVDFHDDQGNLIPGTILLFEDGSVGLYKERNKAKDYDIVYMLKPTSRAEPEGMPLYNYEVEPIGRLSHACFEQVLKTGIWERDMMVFHLLKFKDHLVIPQITRTTELPVHQVSSSDRVSKWTVPKLDESELDDPTTESAAEPLPALTRGRKVTINFGPQQRWEAVYWGRDELGHIVAHHTHETWSLMHLDLNRFKDTIVFHDIVGGDVISRIEKECQKA